MCYRQKLSSLTLIFVLIAFVFPSKQASAFGLSDLNPFSNNLGRIKGRIRPPSLSGTLKKLNSGSQKILSGTKDILFPWTRPRRNRISPPPPPTGTRRIYPANARPNS